MTQKLNTDNGLKGRTTEHQPVTAVWRNGGFSASYDSFVVQQTVVLRMNICGFNPPLRQAAKRYRQLIKKKRHMDEISDSKKIDQIIVMIDKIVNNNGPSEHEYDMLNSMLTKIGELRAEGFLKNEDIIEFQKRFGEAMLTTKTLQGLGCVKPHGYPGDFEIIDKIYTCSITKDDKFKKWDYFFQAQPASIAVRNRKIYFKQLLKTKANNIRILNLASGPCRDMIEYFEENPKSEIIFDCVELDTNAIEFGQDLINKSSIGPTKINFINKNIFKFDTVNKYDLIWSAGLFDYFEDKVFIRILKRFLKNIKNGGEIVIGNFHPKNPSKSYMEFGFWYLNHRTEDDLIKLANSCGIQNKNIEIKSECAGVNLFLHIDNREY